MSIAKITVEYESGITIKLETDKIDCKLVQDITQDNLKTTLLEKSEYVLGDKTFSITGIIKTISVREKS